MKWVFGLLSLTGLNFAIWGTAALLRLIDESKVLARLAGLVEDGVLSTLAIVQRAQGSYKSHVYSGFLFLFWGLFFFAVAENGEVFRLELERVALVAALWLVFCTAGAFMIPHTPSGFRTLASLALWFSFALITGVAAPGTPPPISDVRASTVTLVILGLSALAACIVHYSGIFKFSGFATSERYLAQPPPRRITPNEVAALIPAHNEEAVIEKTIRSLLAILPARNVFVASDASTDGTVAIAERLGVHALSIVPNRGKAGALQYAITTFGLVTHYEAVLIVDADAEVDSHFLKYALPKFDDPKVVAVAGHALTRWSTEYLPPWQEVYAAYRMRFYRLLQTMFRYGQTWRFTCVTPIVPGFSSMYRTRVLPHINIAAPGLVIEDFNMTFEVHHKRLGRIAYTPRAKSATEDPHRFKDYVRQVKRWNLGFWQTVRRHGIWPSGFWIANTLYLAEMIAFALVFACLPILFLMIALGGWGEIEVPLPWVGISRFGLLDLLIGFVLVDYLMTVAVALYERKYILLAYGLFFLPIRYIDTILFLYTFPLAFFVESEGKWKSPTRQGALGSSVVRAEGVQSTA